MDCQDCHFGVTVSMVVMIPATSLIAGFKHEIKEKVFGFGKNEKHEIRIISRNDKKSHSNG